MKKTVLVTGGAGYIGSHTSVELLEAGYNVVIVDNFSNSDSSSLEGIKKITGKEFTFEEIDCNDAVAIDKLFTTYSIDAIIHFAAFKAVGESVSEPLKYYNNNIGSLITILEAMKKHSVSNIVFSSSATVYGQPEVLPATESTPRMRANSPYGMTKQIAEDILEDCARAYNGAVNVIALRYFNPIGAHSTALIGELPKGVPNNLVPFITQTAAGVREMLSIFGSDYNTPDGTALRDYIDVVDLAKAHVVAIDRMVNGKSKDVYEFFNIGTGVPLSVKELVDIFEEVNGVKVNQKLVARREGDVEKVWADTTLANTELGWKAEKTTQETLKSAWAWEKHIRGI
ncbi:MAG: UDP-glucose 4-epimerase GalE [Rikenellaceae bacterium]